MINGPLSVPQKAKSYSNQTCPIWAQDGANSLQRGLWNKKEVLKSLAQRTKINSFSAQENAPCKPPTSGSNWPRHLSVGLEVIMTLASKSPFTSWPQSMIYTAGYPWETWQFSETWDLPLLKGRPVVLLNLPRIHGHLGHFHPNFLPWVLILHPICIVVW